MPNPNKTLKIKINNSNAKIVKTMHGIMVRSNKPPSLGFLEFQAVRHLPQFPTDFSKITLCKNFKSNGKWFKCLELSWSELLTFGPWSPLGPLGPGIPPSP